MDVGGARTVQGARPLVLLVDFPSEDVPVALVRAGCAVHVKGGPGPTDFGVRELHDSAVVARRTGAPPEHVDVVYAHRPLGELAALVQAAAAMGARVFWYQSGVAPDGTKDPRGCWLRPEDSARVRAQVEAAGMAYVDDSYIADGNLTFPRW